MLGAILFLMLACILASSFIGSLGAIFRPSGIVLQSLMASLVFVSAVCSLYIFSHIYLTSDIIYFSLGEWIKVKNLLVQWEIRLDPLSSIMCLVVCSVSSMVHFYSVWYMHDDKNPVLFLFYLSLFTFFMLILVLSNNFVQLFLGWEGVGLCSYLLIGFWGTKPKAGIAADKAFIMNRVGDFGLIIAITLLYKIFHVLHFDYIVAELNYHTLPINQISFLGVQCNLIDVVALCILLGCIGKSAQIFMHGWLVDAMEGPTPASALIHAATMVTAGVFLMARCAMIFDHAMLVRNVALWIGVITALLMAVIAVFQTDIKKTVAYSTCSQLGYMVAACGSGAYPLAIFHLFTHAYFKSLLFLCAGSIIHASKGEQDLSKIGNISRSLPVTKFFTIIAAAAISGFYPLAGYYSKDAIMEAVLVGNVQGTVLFSALAIAALLTSFYSWKIVFSVFAGKRLGNSGSHESLLALLPMSVLAFMSIYAGHWGEHNLKLWVNDNIYFFNYVQVNDLVALGKKTHALSANFKIIPLVMGILGIVIAYFLIPMRRKAPWTQYFNSGMGFEVLYAGIISLVRYLGLVGRWIDVYVVDFLISKLPVMICSVGGTCVAWWHSGKLYHYAFLLLFGLLFMSLYMLLIF